MCHEKVEFLNVWKQNAKWMLYEFHASCVKTIRVNAE